MPNLDKLRQFIQTLTAGGEEIFSGGGPISAADISQSQLPAGENRGVGGILSNFARMRGQGRVGMDQYQREARQDEAKIGLMGAQTDATRALGGLRGAQTTRTNVQAELEPMLAGMKGAKTSAEIDNYASQIEARKHKAEVDYQNAESRSMNAQTDQERLQWQMVVADKKHDLDVVTEAHRNAVAMRNAATGEQNANTAASLAPSKIGLNQAQAGLAGAKTNETNELVGPRKDALTALTGQRNVATEQAPLRADLIQSQTERNKAATQGKQLTAVQKLTAANKMMTLMKARGNGDTEINDAASRVMAGEDPETVLGEYGLGDTGLLEGLGSGVKNFFSGTKPSKPVSPAPVKQTTSKSTVTRTPSPTVSGGKVKVINTETGERGTVSEQFLLANPKKFKRVQ